jgi:hypothetical protein
VIESMCPTRSNVDRRTGYVSLVSHRKSWCVLRSGWMPRVLGWILVGGGVGYVLSAFIRYLGP